MDIWRFFSGHTGGRSKLIIPQPLKDPGGGEVRTLCSESCVPSFKRGRGYLPCSPYENWCDGQWSLPIPEDPGSNPAIGNFLLNITTVNCL